MPRPRRSTKPTRKHSIKHHNDRRRQQYDIGNGSSCWNYWSWRYHTVCLNKKETGTNMPISLKLDKYFNNFGYYLLGGYLLFPTVPRNVGSITSVNENEHFNKRLTIWLCTKSFQFSINQFALADLNYQHTSWYSSQKSREFSLWLNGIEQLACRRLETDLPTDFLVVWFQ